MESWKDTLSVLFDRCSLASQSCCWLRAAKELIPNRKFQGLEFKCRWRR